MKNTTPLIFDGHNDALLHLYKGDSIDGFINGNTRHIDLPKARLGGFGGGFFAIWVPSDMEEAPLFEAMRADSYDIDVPPNIPQPEALQASLAQAAILLRLQRAGALEICTDVAEIRACLNSGKMAAILHMEGAEAIDTGFDSLHVLHGAGLRSLGLVWSRHNDFGYGVPFSFPKSPDTGPGLTDAGKALVRECNDLNIMLDLSHLNAAGFWDVAKISNAPLVATHSNVHALCASSRNLTDDQLMAIKDSDGMVGVNFAVSFLRDDGRMQADMSLDVMMRHLDHLIEHLGEDRVGFGSDFDGAMVPAGIKDASGLGVLRDAMHAHGVDAALMEKLCNGNWLRVLEKTWD